MTREWKDVITTVALTSLATAKYNKIDLLPHTQDLVKLDAFMRKEITECLDQYRDEQIRPTLGRDWFRKLCRATCAYCTVFNKRRGSEVAKMYLTSYVNRPKWEGTHNEEIVSSLSVAEKRMMER